MWVRNELLLHKQTDTNMTQEGKKSLSCPRSLFLQVMQTFVTHGDIHYRPDHRSTAACVTNMQINIWALIIEKYSQSVRGVGRSSNVYYWWMSQKKRQTVCLPPVTSMKPIKSWVDTAELQLQSGIDLTVIDTGTLFLTSCSILSILDSHR